MNNLRGVEDSGAEEYQDKLVLADDAFLDDLARGIDPSDGADALAGLLLDLKAEVDAPMPPAPVISDAPTTMMRPLRNIEPSPGEPSSGEPSSGEPSPEVEPLFDNEAEVAGVVDLQAHREKRSLRQVFMHGLVGAAAATLAIAGSGIAIYNAGPSSPLWGAHVALFSDHAAVVELASTLEQADNSRDRGDVEGALALLDQARDMAAEIQKREAKQSSVTTVTVTQQPTSTSTTATEPTEQPPAEPVLPPPVTVTTTVTVTPTSASSAPVPSTAQPAGPENPNPNPPEPSSPTSAEPSPPGDNAGGN